MMKRDREESRRCFEEAIAADPTNSFAYHSLGMLLDEEFGDSEGALQCYRKAVEVNPENYCAWNSLGLRLKEKHRDEALQCLQTAIQLNGNYSRALKNIALMYEHELKDPAKAHEYLERAAAADPNNASVFVMLGQNEEKRKRYDEAARCYDAAIVADDANPIGYLRRAVLEEIYRKDRAKAKLYYEKTLAIDPNETKALTKMARFEEQDGNFEAARDLLVRAISTHHPSESQLRKNLSYLLQHHFKDDPLWGGINAFKADFSATSPAVTSATNGSMSSSDRAASFDTFVIDTREEETSDQCPFGHGLVRIRFKPPTYSSRATWACEECKKSIGGAELKRQGANYCKLCKYSLCQACAKIEHRTGHIMPQQPQQIGSGGFGTVWKEYDPKLRAYVAVKRVPASAAAMVEREVALMRLFDKHPHIVRVLRCEKQGREMCIYMDLMAGSVEGIIEEEGAIHEVRARQIIGDALSGLAALHSTNPPIVHRDVKPPNILVSMTGRCKLSDFGLSKPQAARTAMNTMAAKGTPQFIAPECFADPPRWTPRADVWALACAWISMTTGRAPYEPLIAPDVGLETMAWQFISKKDLKPPIPGHLSEPAKQLLARCLETNPELRPDCKTLLADPYFTKPPNVGLMEPPGVFRERAHAIVEQRAAYRATLGGTDGYTTSSSGAHYTYYAPTVDTTDWDAAGSGEDMSAYCTGEYGSPMTAAPTASSQSASPSSVGSAVARTTTAPPPPQPQLTLPQSPSTIVKVLPAATSRASGVGQPRRDSNWTECRSLESNSHDRAKLVAIQTEPATPPMHSPTVSHVATPLLPPANRRLVAIGIVVLAAFVLVTTSAG